MLIWIFLSDRFDLSEDESTLTIYNVQQEDQGQFKCEAENIPGEWDISYYLEVTCTFFHIPWHCFYVMVVICTV